MSFIGRKFGSFRKTPTPEQQQSRGVSGDSNYPAHMNPFHRAGSPSIAAPQPQSGKKWPTVQVNPNDLRTSPMVSDVTPIVDNSHRPNSQNLSPAPMSPHLTGGSGGNMNYYGGGNPNDGRTSPFQQRQPSPLSASHSPQSAMSPSFGGGYGGPNVHGRLSPGPAPPTSFPQGNVGPADQQYQYSQQQYFGGGFQQPQPTGGQYPNIQYSPTMGNPQMMGQPGNAQMMGQPGNAQMMGHQQQTTVYTTNTTVEHITSGLNDMGFVEPQPGTNNPFANSGAGGGNGGGHNAGPRRAGTFDAETGTFRNIADLRNMTEEQILEMFDDIDGVSLLREVDTVLVMDNSKSMADYGFWPLAKAVLSYLAPIVGAYDENGYSAYVLNRRGGQQSDDDHENGIAGGGWHGLRDGHEVMRILDTIVPAGSTPIDLILRRILEVYLTRLAREANESDLTPLNPINIVFLTDGAADDREEVQNLIMWACQQLHALGMPPNQIGIQFLQVGNLQMAQSHLMSQRNISQAKLNGQLKTAEREIKRATAWLQQLDDFMGDLASNPEFQDMHDIVDTKNADDILREGGFDPVVLIVILCGALNKRFDKKKISGRQ